MFSIKSQTPKLLHLFGGKKNQRRFTKLSLVEMLNRKNEKKAEWKDKELEIRQQELKKEDKDINSSLKKERQCWNF
jgi:hypothetical protein